MCVSRQLVDLGVFCANIPLPGNGGRLLPPCASRVFPSRVLRGSGPGRFCLLPDYTEVMLPVCPVALAQTQTAVSPHSSSRVRGKQMQREIKRLKTDLVGHLGHAKGQPRPGAGLPTCVARTRRALRGHAAGSAKEAVSRAGLCPVCSLEPAAQRPQQHRWWDEPGGA